MAQTVKNLPALQEPWVRSPGREDPLEKRMAAQSSILAWRIPWTERSLAGYSPWSHKESDTTEQLTTAHSTPLAGSLKRIKLQSISYMQHLLGDQ